MPLPKNTKYLEAELSNIKKLIDSQDSESQLLGLSILKTSEIINIFPYKHFGDYKIDFKAYFLGNIKYVFSCEAFKENFSLPEHSEPFKEANYDLFRRNFISDVRTSLKNIKCDHSSLEYTYNLLDVTLYINYSDSGLRCLKLFSSLKETINKFKLTPLYKKYKNTKINIYKILQLYLKIPSRVTTYSNTNILDFANSAEYYKAYTVKDLFKIAIDPNSTPLCRITNNSCLAVMLIGVFIILDNKEELITNIH